MKQKILLAAIMLIPFLSEAQLGGLLSKVKNKITQKTNQRIDSKVDKTIDKTLDEMEGKTTSPKTTSAEAVTETSKEQYSMESFSKYDFIPGEKILYAEDFVQEAMGELPTGWNTNGSGEVVNIASITGKWLKLHHSFVYLTANTKAFPENFTIEFDMILQLKNNGWMYPTFSCGFFDSKEETTTDNTFLKNYKKNAALLATIYPEENTRSRTLVESFIEGKSYFKSEPKMYAELKNYYGKPIHVAIQVQKERFRIWVNAVKMFDVPKGVPSTFNFNQLFFEVGSTNYAETNYGVFVSNIKAATGVPDTRHKLIEEGKFSTTGILFDVNSANIKPESYGVIKEIGTVLKENPSIKIKIIGHTSSDGDDKANLELSKKRAAAVKEVLINEYAIADAVMETDGKGETQPVGDNKTKEGKVANRRVEFIKL
jgi:OmpA-OmpF porin, OOP family